MLESRYFPVEHVKQFVEMIEQVKHDVSQIRTGRNLCWKLLLFFIFRLVLMLFDKLKACLDNCKSNGMGEFKWI